MGADDIVVTSARLAGRMTNDSFLVEVADIAGDVLSYAQNPLKLVFDVAGRAIEEFTLKDGMKPGTVIHNDINLYQAGIAGADLNLAFISVSPETGENLLFRAVDFALPLGSLPENAQRVMGAQNDVRHHHQLIAEMAERGVPGFIHEIVILDGEPRELFAQVPLQTPMRFEDAVTYLERYNGTAPQDAVVFDKERDVRQYGYDIAAIDLLDWAETSEIEASRLLHEEGTELSWGEINAAARNTTQIAYQELKGTAIRDIIAERNPDIQADATPIPTIAENQGPENLLDQVNDGVDEEQTFTQAFSDLGTPTPSV